MKQIPFHALSFVVLCMMATAVAIAACASQSAEISPMSVGTTQQPAFEEPTFVPLETQNVPGETKVYRDELAGIALDYPAGWYREDSALQYAAESVIYSVSLVSWDPSSVIHTVKDLNTLPEGGSKIEITVFTDRSGTLAEAVSQYKNQDSGTPVEVLREISWTLSNGIEAYYFESEGTFGIVATMISIVNKKVIYVSGYGDLAPFEAIARSLRTD